MTKIADICYFAKYLLFFLSVAFYFKHFNNKKEPPYLCYI